MKERLKYVAFKGFMGIDENGKPSFYSTDGVNTHVQENLRDFARIAREKPELRTVGFQQGYQMAMIFMVDSVHDDTFDSVFCKKYRGDMNAVLEHEFNCRIVPQPHELEYRAFPPKRDLW